LRGQRSRTARRWPGCRTRVCRTWRHRRTRCCRSRGRRSTRRGCRSRRSSSWPLYARHLTWNDARCRCRWQRRRWRRRTLFLDAQANRGRHDATRCSRFDWRRFRRAGCRNWSGPLWLRNRFFDWRRRWWRRCNLDRSGRRFDDRLRRRRRRFDGRRRWRFFDDGFRFDGCHGRRRCGWRHGRLRRFDEARRRQHRGRRLRRLRSLFRGRRLLALLNGRLGKDVATRQRDATLLRETIHELPRDDLFDRARRALDFDSVIALEQRRHFLARRAEQFRDFINPDS